MLWVATTILALAPQGGTVVRDREGRIILPPVQQQNQQPRKATQDPVIRDGIQRRFHARAFELRRSRFLSVTTEDDLLRKIGVEFEDAPERALKLARLADDDLMHGLMRIVATYGGPVHAEEIRFLLQTRALGKATRVAVRTMADIGRDKTRDLLFDCLTARRDPVRRFAAAELASHLVPDDASKLIALATQGRSEVRVRATRLLGRIETPEVEQFLVESLHGKARVAETATRALIARGVKVAAPLQEIVRQPAKGRGFGFAAYALSAIEDTTGRELLTDDMRDHLLAELDMPDAFMRTTASIALAGMAWRSSATSGDDFADRDVVDNLVTVVASSEAVPHLALVQDLARRRLTRFAGKEFGLQNRRWREWWSNAKTQSDYVGARRRLAVDTESAKYAVLTWEDQSGRIRLRGEHIDPLPPSKEFVLELLVDGDEFVALIGDLEKKGFMRDSRARELEATGKRLRLTVRGARCQTDPLLGTRVIDRLGGVVRTAASARSWQLYRDPEKEPHVTAFWRSERRWLAAHTDPIERAERLSDRIIERLDSLVGDELGLAVQHLGSLPELRQVIDAEDAASLLQVLERRKIWDEHSDRIADFVLAAGDSAPWQKLLTVAESKADDQAPAVLARLFGLLGPERILESIRTGSKEVRIAAMDEVVKIKDVRAVELLVGLLADKDTALRTTAAFTLGKLRAVEARQPLIDILVEGGEQTSPHLRRIIWIALARIGGEEVFPILSGAFYSPALADRRAVLQAMAELRHPGAAVELGKVFALRGPDDDLGIMALQLIRGLGDVLGSPALRPHLESDNASVRLEAARTLGEFGDPSALPILIEMLDTTEQPLPIVAVIASMTGIDVTERNDRVPFLRNWWRTHASTSQGQWLIEALAANKVSNTLNADLLGEGSGTAQVAELSRLLVEANPAYLRPLAARVLRVTTGEDYGLVTIATDDDSLRGIAERYRFLGDSDKAASGR